MLKRLAALILLSTAAAYAQTASLVAHIGSTETENPVTSTVLTGAQTANALLVIVDNSVAVSDSDNHAFVKIFDLAGYGTHTTVWAALGATISASDTITTSNNYSHVSSLILAFSNVASFDKSANQTNTNLTPLPVGPVTPSNPNSLLVGIVAGVYNTTPIVTIADSPSPPTFNTVDTGSMHYASIADFTDGYAIEGAGTPTAVTMNATTNQYNGQMASVLVFATKASPLPLTTSTTSLPSDMRTHVYPQTCINVAGGSAPYTITLADGILPTGLTFDGKCITGTPTVAGTSSGLVFHIVDNSGAFVNTNALSIVVTPLVTTLDMHHPYEGFPVFPQAVRHLGVYETDPGPTGKLNYTIPEGPGFATLSCTTNCVGTVTVTVTGAAKPATIAGTVGSYSITGATDFHVVATNVDRNEDGTYSTDSAPFHIIKGDHLVATTPDYNQAFFGQQKTVYSYVLGQVQQDVTWSCTAPNGSDCSASLDVGLPTGTGAGTRLHNRDTVITTPSVAGRYKLTACSTSVYDGSQACAYSWIYAGGPLTAAHNGTAALPVTKQGTEMTACFADPAFGTRSYTVKADGTGTFSHIYDLPVQDSTYQFGPGYLAQVFNTDTTGTNPTQFAEWIDERTGGTVDQPVYICGVTDAAGNMPIWQGNNAVNPHGDIYNGPSFQGAIIIVGKFGTADLSDYEDSGGPDHVDITGFNIRDDGAITNGDNRMYGIWVQSGRHVNLEGNKFDRLVDGAYELDNAFTVAGRHTEFQSLIGNYFDNCSRINSSGDHCAYVQGMHPLVVGNHFGTTVPGAGGSWIKVRGGDSILAYNDFHGQAGYTNNFYGVMSDSANYEDLSMTLGGPGVTDCNSSTYCVAMATKPADLNWLHVVENEEALAHDYFYGNIYEKNASGAPLFSYGSQEAYETCGHGGDTSLYAYCTEGADHIGGFMNWNNTFDRPGTLGQSNNVFYNNFYLHPGVFSWPFLTYQNNSMWSDGGQTGTFVIDGSPEFQGAFKTNMFASGAHGVSLATPIVAGQQGLTLTNLGGQGSNGPEPIWYGYSPKDSYLIGMTAPNFLNTATIPYDTTTYQPIAGSPLTGAGTAITDPLMTILPVRWEPDPVGGYVIARKDSVSTIGARSGSTPCTLAVTTTSLNNATRGAAYSYALTASCGTSPYTWALTSGTLPTGLTLSSSGTISGTPTSGTASGLVFRATDAVGATASSPSLTLTVNPAGLTVTTLSLPSGTAGVSYSYTLAATGGNPPYTWGLTSGPLPAGITLSPSTGALSGTPTTAGTTTGLVFTATDSAAATAASNAFSLVITAPTPPPSSAGTQINGNVTITGGVVIQ